MANRGKTPKEKIISELENTFQDLKVGERAMVFKLKDKKKNHQMFSIRKKIHKDGGVVQLRYSKTFDTPFFEEQNPEMEAQISAIEFEDGLLYAPKHDVCLQKFLIASPLFEDRYFLEDKEKEAEQELKRYEIIDELRDFVSKSEPYEIKSVLAELKTFSEAERMSKVEARLAILKLIDIMPVKVKEVINSEDRRMRYTFLTALNSSFLIEDRKENVIRWADTKDVAFSYAPGRRPVDEFIKFINKPDGGELKTKLKEKMRG